MDPVTVTYRTKYQHDTVWSKPMSIDVFPRRGESARQAFIRIFRLVFGGELSYEIVSGADKERIERMCADCFYKKLQGKSGEQGWCYMFKTKPTGACMQFRK